MSNLPTAALITSTVAMILFLVKEIYESLKKKKEKKTKINAIRDIAAREVFNLTRDIEFFVNLNQMRSGSTDVTCVESYGGKSMQFCFHYQLDLRYIFIPKYSTMFDHLFLVESAKVSIELTNTLHNLNTAIFYVSQVIDSCIGFVKNKDFDDFNDAIDFMLEVESNDGEGMVMSFLPIIDQFKNNVEKINGFSSAYMVLNSHYRPQFNKI